MTQRKLTFLFEVVVSIFVAFIISCTNHQEDAELNKLKNWMTGSFSSEEQSKLDTNFHNIHLHMVPIWPVRNDGIWLYVEQAAAWASEKPYRQRVYHITGNENGTFNSAVFSINKPFRFSGVWKQNQPLVELTPDSLIERTGCTIVLRWNDGVFTGSTIDKNCMSNLRGAAYATSQVRIEENLLTSWDRGFDENNNQVWGAVIGPYKFSRIK